jgi:DNA adenine methylase
MGSKARYAKHIVPFLMNGHDQDRLYIEPFMGGGNMLSNVPAKHKWGNDTAEYAVALLEAVANGWEPPETLTQDEYYAIKATPDGYDAALVGFAGYCCSYGGKFWGGYARGNTNDGTPRDHANEAYRNIISQAYGLSGVKFTCGSYLELDIDNGSTVYCDPPYESTTGYGGGFDHVQFWQWASDLSKICRVFVSEYNAPDDWNAIWQKEVNNSLTANTGGKKATESLFVLRGGLADQEKMDLFS